MFLSGNVSESKFHYIDCKHGPSRLHDCKGLQPLFEKSIVAVFPLSQEGEEGGKNNASNHASNLAKVVLHEPHRLILMSRLNPVLYERFLKVGDEDPANRDIFHDANSIHRFISSTGPSSALVFPHGAFLETQTGAVQVTSGKDTYVIRFHGCSGGPQTHFAPFNFSSRSKFPLFDMAAYFGDRSAGAFYHTMVEQLPRVVVVRQVVESFPGLTLLYHQSRSLVNYTHELFGEDMAKRLVDISSTSYAYSQVLVVPQ